MAAALLRQFPITRYFYLLSVAVIDWLTFYNHRRLHSTLGYVIPMQFEKNCIAAQLKDAA